MFVFKDATYVTQIDGIKYYWKKDQFYETDGRITLPLRPEDVPFPVLQLYEAMAEREREDLGQRKLWRSDWMDAA